MFLTNKYIVYVFFCFPLTIRLTHLQSIFSPNTTHTHTIVLIFLLDEHWEKELEAELQDFELVDNEHPANSAGAATTDWEKDVEDLLGDCEDLK